MQESVKRNPGRCKGPNCKKEIFWLPKKLRDGTERLHPYDDPDGQVSHFVTCPDSHEFRSGKIPTKGKPAA